MENSNFEVCGRGAVGLDGPGVGESSNHGGMAVGIEAGCRVGP